VAGGGGKAAKGRSLARITNKCWALARKEEHVEN